MQNLKRFVITTLYLLNNKYIAKITLNLQEKFYLCTRIFEKKNVKTKGALAHLARALDWQSKGDEFESRMLHEKNNYFFSFCLNLFCTFAPALFKILLLPTFLKKLLR